MLFRSTSVGISDSQPFAAIRAKPLVDIDKMRYVLMFWSNDETFEDDDIDTKAKQLTDNKVILHQEKVKTLIETLSVKVKKTDNQEENKKSDNETVNNKNTEGLND